MPHKPVTMPRNMPSSETTPTTQNQTVDSGIVDLPLETTPPPLETTPSSNDFPPTSPVSGDIPVFTDNNDIDFERAPIDFPLHDKRRECPNPLYSRPLLSLISPDSDSDSDTATDKYFGSFAEDDDILSSPEPLSSPPPSSSRVDHNYMNVTLKKRVDTVSSISSIETSTKLNSSHTTDQKQHSSTPPITERDTPTSEQPASTTSQAPPITSQAPPTTNQAASTIDQSPPTTSQTLPTTSQVLPTTDQVKKVPPTKPPRKKKLSKVNDHHQLVEDKKGPHSSTSEEESQVHNPVSSSYSYTPGHINKDDLNWKRSHSDGVTRVKSERRRPPPPPPNTVRSVTTPPNITTPPVAPPDTTLLLGTTPVIVNKSSSNPDLLSDANDGVGSGLEDRNSSLVANRGSNTHSSHLRRLTISSPREPTYSFDWVADRNYSDSSSLPISLHNSAQYCE